MQPENFNKDAEQANQVTQASPLHKVTPLSKYLAMALFILLPFLGGYIGYTFAPEKVVEVEKEIVREMEAEKVVEVGVPIEVNDDAATAASKNKNETDNWITYNDMISGINFQHPRDWSCETKVYTVQGVESPYIQCRSSGSVVLDLSLSNFPDSNYSDFVEQPELTEMTDNYTRTIRFRNNAGLGPTAVILYTFNYSNQNFSAFVPYKNQNGWSHEYYASQEEAIRTVDLVVASIF